MPCFLTFSCEGQQATLRRSSASPLNRGFRNVSRCDVFRHWLLTLVQTHYTYRLFRTHKETFTLFCSVTLLRVAEWIRVEWRGKEWSKGYWLRGSETLLKPMFRSLWANFLVKQMEFELCWEEAWTALSASFAKLEKRYRTKGFWSKIW